MKRRSCPQKKRATSFKIREINIHKRENLYIINLCLPKTKILAIKVKNGVKGEKVWVM